jgi:predicted glycosyltransferase
MNREAAAMDVPVYSIFRGTIGAVDRYLAQTNRLVLIESVEELQTKLLLAPRTRSSAVKIGNSETLRTIVNHIVSVMEGKGERLWQRNGKPSTI